MAVDNVPPFTSSAPQQPAGTGAARTCLSHQAEMSCNGVRPAYGHNVANKRAKTSGFEDTVRSATGGEPSGPSSNMQSAFCQVHGCSCLSWDSSHGGLTPDTATAHELSDSMDIDVLAQTSAKRAHSAPEGLQLDALIAPMTPPMLQQLAPTSPPMPRPLAMLPIARSLPVGRSNAWMDLQATSFLAHLHELEDDRGRPGHHLDPVQQQQQQQQLERVERCPKELQQPRVALPLSPAPRSHRGLLIVAPAGRPAVAPTSSWAPAPSATSPSGAADSNTCNPHDRDNRQPHGSGDCPKWAAGQAAAHLGPLAERQHPAGAGTSAGLATASFSAEDPSQVVTLRVLEEVHLRLQRGLQEEEEGEEEGQGQQLGGVAVASRQGGAGSGPVAGSPPVLLLPFDLERSALWRVGPPRGRPPLAPARRGRLSDRAGSSELTLYGKQGELQAPDYEPSLMARSTPTTTASPGVGRSPAGPHSPDARRSTLTGGASPFGPRNPTRWGLKPPPGFCTAPGGSGAVSAANGADVPSGNVGGGSQAGVCWGGSAWTRQTSPFANLALAPESSDWDEEEEEEEEEEAGPNPEAVSPSAGRAGGFEAVFEFDEEGGRDLVRGGGRGGRSAAGPVAEGITIPPRPASPVPGPGSCAPGGWGQEPGVGGSRPEAISPAVLPDPTFSAPCAAAAIAAAAASAAVAGSASAAAAAAAPPMDDEELDDYYLNTLCGGRDPLAAFLQREAERRGQEGARSQELLSGSGGSGSGEQEEGAEEREAREERDEESGHAGVIEGEERSAITAGVGAEWGIGAPADSTMEVDAVAEDAAEPQAAPEVEAARGVTDPSAAAVASAGGPSTRGSSPSPPAHSPSPPPPFSRSPVSAAAPHVPRCSLLLRQDTPAAALGCNDPSTPPPTPLLGMVLPEDDGPFFELSLLGEEGEEEEDAAGAAAAVRQSRKAVGEEAGGVEREGGQEQQCHDATRPLRAGEHLVYASPWKGEVEGEMQQEGCLEEAISSPRAPDGSWQQQQPRSRGGPHPHPLLGCPGSRGPGAGHVAPRTGPLHGVTPAGPPPPASQSLVHPHLPPVRTHPLPPVAPSSLQWLRPSAQPRFDSQHLQQQQQLPSLQPQEQHHPHQHQHQQQQPAPSVIVLTGACCDLHACQLRPCQEEHLRRQVEAMRLWQQHGEQDRQGQGGQAEQQGGQQLPPPRCGTCRVQEGDVNFKCDFWGSEDNDCQRETGPAATEAAEALLAGGRRQEQQPGAADEGGGQGGGEDGESGVVVALQPVASCVHCSVAGDVRRLVEAVVWGNCFAELV